MERLTHPRAMERRAKRDAARRQYYERKRAADAKSALENADAPTDAPVNAPTPLPLKAPVKLRRRGTSSINPLATTLPNPAPVAGLPSTIASRLVNRYALLNPFESANTSQPFYIW
jgi:hypothetical protein